MRDFELVLEVQPMDEGTEDVVAEALDAVISCHSGVTLVAAVVEGSDAVEAARGMIDVLRTAGARPVRLVDDLVTRAQIASRAVVTRQAVSAWTRGERAGSVAFPAPFVLAGDGLWLWGEVVDVLVARGVLSAEGIGYPSRREAQIINALLVSDDLTHGWSPVATATNFGLTSAPAAVRFEIAADSIAMTRAAWAPAA